MADLIARALAKRAADQADVVNQQLIVQPMKNMCLYYGKPDTINNVNDALKAGAIFANYDIMVLNGLQMDPLHSWHSACVQTVAEARRLNPELEVFGYIHSHDSETAGNLTAAEVRERVIQWRDLVGATGIFFDAFGYDYEVTRVRQNELVGIAKSENMRIIANSWMPDYVFSNQNITLGSFQGNPSLLPCQLDENDYYLFENHIYRRAYYVETQEANDTARIYQSLYYRFVPQDEYGGKSYYEQYKTRTLSLNGLEEPNERFFNEGYLVALGTGCHGYGMSGSEWSDPNYSHFTPPKVKGRNDKIKLLTYTYDEGKSELSFKTDIDKQHTIEVTWNQPDAIKGAYEFPSDPYVFRCDITGTLNVNSTIQVTLNRVNYYPPMLNGDTAEVVAQKLAAFDYGPEWIVTREGTRVKWQYHSGNPTYYQRGAGTSTDFKGMYLYINSSKGLVLDYDILTVSANVIRRITLDGDFLLSQGGPKVLRPKNPKIGTSYFDTTLNKVVWWNGTDYVDAMGVAAN